MGLKLNSEQLGFQDSLQKFFYEKVDSAYLRNRIDSKKESDPKLWQEIKELALFEYFADRDEKPSTRELVIIAEEAGKVLLPENLLENLFFGSYLFNQILEESSLKFDDVNQKICFGYINSASQENIKIKKENDIYNISGNVHFVIGADKKSHLLLLIENKDKTNLYLLDTNLEKIEFKKQDVLDLTLSRYQINLSSNNFRLISCDSDFITAFNKTLKAAEILGICKKVVDLTKEYVATRKQFEVPIGGFQAVQHKLVDMYLYTESLSALVDFASWASDSSKEQLQIAGNSAIAYACDYGLKVVEHAIQLHGGTGFTWEYDLHLYLRRIITLKALYGFKESEVDGFLDLALTI